MRRGVVPTPGTVTDRRIGSVPSGAGAVLRAVICASSGRRHVCQCCARQDHRHDDQADESSDALSDHGPLRRRQASRSRRALRAGETACSHEFRWVAAACDPRIRRTRRFAGGAVPLHGDGGSASCAAQEGSRSRQSSPPCQSPRRTARRQQKLVRCRSRYCSSRFYVAQAPFKDAAGWTKGALCCLRSTDPGSGNVSHRAGPEPGAMRRQRPLQTLTESARNVTGVPEGWKDRSRFHDRCWPRTCSRSRRGRCYCPRCRSHR